MSRQAQANTLTDDQLAGRACIECGKADAPLHPAGTVTIPDGDIDHVYDTVVCTEHLVLNR